MGLDLSLGLNDFKSWAHNRCNRPSSFPILLSSPCLHSASGLLSWRWYCPLSNIRKDTNLPGLFVGTKHCLQSQADTGLFAKIMALLGNFFQSFCIWIAQDDKRKSRNFESDFRDVLYNSLEEVLRWVIILLDYIYCSLERKCSLTWHCTFMAHPIPVIPKLWENIQCP